MAAEITPFAFPDTGQPVRTVMTNGQPWFVAKDVCAVLGIGNPSDAVRSLDDDEYRLVPAALVSNEGRPQDTFNLVNEPGLYSLILRSRKPEAKAFKRWIVHEVLPMIRQTGSYDTAPQRELSRKEMARYWYEAEERAESAERRAAELEAPAEAWNVLASSDPDYSVREAAYILNRDPAIDTGQNKLFNELRRMRVIDSRDIPYSGHAHHVKLRPRSFTNRATGNEHPAKPQVRITAAGLAYLHKKLGGTAPLELPEQVS